MHVYCVSSQIINTFCIITLLRFDTYVASSNVGINIFYTHWVRSYDKEFDIFEVKSSIYFSSPPIHSNTSLYFHDLTVVPSCSLLIVMMLYFEIQSREWSKTRCHKYWGSFSYIRYNIFTFSLWCFEPLI
jgi:hypothetical protein